MTKNFSRIMSGIACLFLIALALRGWTMNNKKNTASPASAGVVENGEVMRPAEFKPRRAQIVIQNRIGGGADSSNNK